jgi:hypothetical protein
MLDHALEATFVAYLQSDPAFDGVFLSTGHDNEEHQLPSVTVSSKSEPLSGSAVVFRADLTLVIESEAHDSNPGQHATLVENVRGSLADKAAVGAAINAGDRVCLYGYAFTESSLDVDGSRFRTSLTLKAGYGVP